MFLARGIYGQRTITAKADNLKFVGEAIPRDAEFPSLTVNSHRNESLTHTCSLKSQERRKQKKGLIGKKRKGEAIRMRRKKCDIEDKRGGRAKRVGGGDEGRNQERGEE